MKKMKNNLSNHLPNKTYNLENNFFSKKVRKNTRGPYSYYALKSVIDSCI